MSDRERERQRKMPENAANDLPPMHDDDGTELPPENAAVAVRWLTWGDTMTRDQAIETMTKRKLGPIRSMQRRGAIDVADFVRSLKA